MIFTAYCVIYAIIDPSTGEIVYVGQAKDFRNRMLSHYYKRKDKTKKTRVHNWISKRVREGLELLFIILENVNCLEKLNEREIYWIAKLSPRLNHTAGGSCGRFIIKRKRKYNFDLNKIKSMLKNGATLLDIAKEVGCSKENAQKYLRENNLKTKNSIHCNPDGSFNVCPSRRIISKEELLEFYCDKLLSCTEIAQIKNCSAQAIKAWLRKYGIPRRTQSQSMKIRYARGMINGFREHDAKGNKICR